MKINVTCFECMEDARELDKDKEGQYIPSYLFWEAPLIEVDKWPYFKVECERGHKCDCMINNELYELLFQQAVYCIMDGYYREAVCTFTSALERYFEYVIEILSYDKDRCDDYHKLWKGIKKHSERQLGAYYSLWYTKLGKVPVLLDDDKVSLRNRVVHQGELVSCEVAKEFGEYIFDYIRAGNIEINKIPEIQRVECYFNRMARICKKDIEKFEKNQTKSKINGEEMYRGIAGLRANTLITDTSINKFSDCFEKKNTEYYGLIK